MKLKSLAILALFSLLLTASCGSQKDKKGIDLNLNIKPVTLTDSTYIKMDYTFGYTEKFTGLTKNYIVFTHFYRPRTREMLFQDDHSPAVPSRDWKKGTPVKYSRTVFMPQFLDELDVDFEGYEEIKLTVGIYDPENPASKIILSEKKLNIQPASIVAPEILYSEGWNNEEADPSISNPEHRKWRWSTKQATCIIEKLNKKSYLIVRGRVDKKRFKDQKVIIKINDTLLEEFIPEEGLFKKQYTLTPDKLGNESEFKLTIETDKTFIPSEINPEINDSRELGVQIFFLYYRESLDDQS